MDPVAVPPKVPSVRSFSGKATLYRLLGPAQIHQEIVRLAFAAVDLALPKFEEAFPSENDVRQAVEAARACVGSPTLGNSRIAQEAGASAQDSYFSLEYSSTSSLRCVAYSAALLAFSAPAFAPIDIMPIFSFLSVTVWYNSSFSEVEAVEFFKMYERAQYLDKLANKPLKVGI